MAEEHDLGKATLGSSYGIVSIQLYVLWTRVAELLLCRRGGKIPVDFLLREEKCAMKTCQKKAEYCKDIQSSIDASIWFRAMPPILL